MKTIAKGKERFMAEIKANAGECNKHRKSGQ